MRGAGGPEALLGMQGGSPQIPTSTETACGMDVTT